MAKTNLGRVSIISRGKYSSATKYERLDIVSYQGSSYIAKQDCTGVVPTNTAYWDLIAEKGETGKTDVSIAKNLNSADLWEMSGRMITTGGKYASTTIATTSSFIPEEVQAISTKGLSVFLMAWDSSGSYVGNCTGDDFSKTSENFYFTEYIPVAAFRAKFQGYKFHLMAKVTSVDEAAKIEFLSEIYSAIHDATRKPMITFIDDDGWEEALDNWESISDETGVKPSFAIVTGFIGAEGKAPWDKIKRLWNRGFEFASHTHSHLKLTDLTDAEIISECSKSANVFNEHGMRCEFLVYPHNASNVRVVNIVKKYFKGAFWGGNVVNLPPVSSHMMNRHNLTYDTMTSKTFADGITKDVYEFRPEEELFRAIDDAIKNKGWLVFLSHARNNGGFYFDDEKKDMVIRLIKYAVQNGCVPATMSEGYNAYKNLYENGVYKYSDNYYIINCDGGKYEK